MRTLPTDTSCLRLNPLQRNVQVLRHTHVISTKEYSATASLLLCAELWLPCPHPASVGTASVPE